MTTRPEMPLPFAPEAEHDEPPRRRYAAQRMAAARVGGLAERMLLTRARCEGEAHRRSESAEQAALPEA